jgi:hypothetical protein
MAIDKGVDVLTIHDGIPHSCPGINAAKWPKVHLTGTHIEGPSTWYRKHTDIHQRYILSRLANIRRGFGTIVCVWITAASKEAILQDLSYCFCTWKEGCLFINSNVASYSFSGKCSKQADLSFGEFTNGSWTNLLVESTGFPQLLRNNLLSIKFVNPNFLREVVRVHSPAATHIVPVGTTPSLCFVWGLTWAARADFHTSSWPSC